LQNVSIINNVGDVDILSLSDLTIEGMNSDYTVKAGGAVDIQSDGNLSLGTSGTISGADDVVIDAGGTVDFTAEADFNIYGGEDGYVEAENGNLNITAGGSVYISDGDLEAYSSDTSTCDGPSLGNVTIDGTGSVGIYNGTYIYGDGDVSISSFGTIALDRDDTSSGSLTIEDSWVEAGGSVDIEADGTAYFSDDEIMADNGSVTINGGGDVDIYDSSTISANGSVEIQSDGTLNIGSEETVNLLDEGYDVSITAGDTVTLSAESDVNVTDTYVDAGGNVCITSGSTSDFNSGSVDIEDSDVAAGDSECGGSLYVKAYDGDVTINESTLTAGSENVLDQDIEPLSGSQEVDDNYISASGDGEVLLSSDSTSSDGYANASSGGDIKISAAGTDGGTVTVSDSTLDIHGDSSISDMNVSPEESDEDLTISGGGGSVCISGDNVSVDGSEISGNNICISGSNISSDGGNVYITDSGSLTISGGDTASICDTTIKVNNIKICDTIITADDGNITIDNEGTASIPCGDESDTFTVDTVSISDSGISASGNVDISANGDVTINNSPISATVGPIVSTDSESSGDEVSIRSGGQLTITGDDGDGYIGDTQPGYDIGADSKICLTGENGVSISDAVIATLDGDSSDLIKISSGGEIDLENNVDIESDGSVKLRACDDVYTYESSISANGGDVSICAGSYIDLEFTDVSADGSVNLNACGSVTVYNDNLCMDDWDIDAGSYVDLGANGGIYISGNEITAEDGDVSIQSNDGGDICISGETTISASGNICIDSEGTVSISELSTASDSVDVEDSTFTAGGNVYVNADGDINICDTTISASGNISITGEGTAVTVSESTLTAGTSDVVSEDIGADSPFEINNCYISTGEGEVSVSTDNTSSDGYLNASSGGDIKISATGTDGGVVSICDSSIDMQGDTSMNDVNVSPEESEEDLTISGGGGSICITGNNISVFGSEITGNNICISGSDISADGSVTISDSGSLTISGDDTASICDTTIKVNNIKICDSTITAEDGDVTIEDDGTANIPCGDESDTFTVDTVSISDSEISASGNVNISANGDINICDTTISATDEGTSDKVSMSSGGELNISGSETVGTSIEADHEVCLYGDDGVSLDDTLIETLDGCSYDKIKVTGYGEIEITDDSELETSGSIKVEAYDGDVSVENSTISAGASVCLASDNGMLTVDEGYDFIDDGNPENPGCYDINAGGTVSMSGECLSIKDATIYGGDGITLTGTDGDVKIKDVDMATDTGDVDITTDSGSLKLEEGCADYGVEIDAGGAVTLTADDNVFISESEITAEGGDVSIESNDGGDICISGETTISASGNICIGTSDNMDIEDSTLTAGGNVYINNNGDLSASSAIIEASGLINLSVDGTVSFSDVDLTATSGDVDVSGGSDVDVEGSSALAIDGTITLSSTDGTLTLGSSSRDVFLAGGLITLSAEGDVTIGINSSINTLNGDIDITSTSGDVDITGSQIGAGLGSVNSSATITANGAVNVSGGSITAANTLTINSDTATINGGASVQAFYINVNSPDGILIDGGSGGTLSGNTMTLTGSMGDSSDDTSGDHSVTVQNEDLGNFANVNIQSHTVNLNGDNFSSSGDYNFTSFHHGYHIGDGNVGGYVNFNNDTLDHNAITSSDAAGTVNPNNNGGIGLGGTGAGIHIN
jgi:hypothetical protein